MSLTFALFRQVNKERRDAWRGDATPFDVHGNDTRAVTADAVVEGS